jgi:hypothetical protein
MRRLYSIASDDCLRSCVASLLEVPCEKVPIFSTSGGGEKQHASAQRWLERNYGVTMAVLLIPPGMKISDLFSIHFRPIRFIACVPTGDEHHAVVAGCYGNRLRVIHDPSELGRIDLRLATDVRFIVPVFKRGIQCRLPQSKQPA